jgi:hypothetical protein
MAEFSWIAPAITAVQVNTEADVEKRAVKLLEQMNEAYERLVAQREANNVERDDSE